jgi:hypothetical protein
LRTDYSGATKDMLPILWGHGSGKTAFDHKYLTGSDWLISQQSLNNKAIFLFILNESEKIHMEEKPDFIDKLKKRWGIGSTRQAVIILVVFSCTGISVLYTQALARDLIGIPQNAEWYYRVLFFLVITLPLYNILLLIFGFIFGQFHFFLEFEKRFFRGITGRFNSKKEND